MLQNVEIESKSFDDISCRIVRIILHIGLGTRRCDGREVARGGCLWVGWNLLEGEEGGCYTSNRPIHPTHFCNLSASNLICNVESIWIHWTKTEWTERTLRVYRHTKKWTTNPPLTWNWIGDVRASSRGQRSEPCASDENCLPPVSVWPSSFVPIWPSCSRIYLCMRGESDERSGLPKSVHLLQSCQFKLVKNFTLSLLCW